MKVYKLVEIINDATSENIDIDWLLKKRFDKTHKLIFSSLLKKRYPNCRQQWIEISIDKNDYTKIGDSYYKIR